MFPLVTQALPLLLLFVTFLFINAEVWQVSSTLDGGVMWLAVMLFAGMAVGFLLVRLPRSSTRSTTRSRAAGWSPHARAPRWRRRPDSSPSPGSTCTRTRP